MDFERELGALGLPGRLADLGLTYRDLALPYLPEFAIAELQVEEYLDDKALLKSAFRPFERLADVLTLLAEPPDPLARLCEDALARLRGEACHPLNAARSQYQPVIVWL
jgi:hypothetical protein